jgi:hypothetical protein
LWEERLGSSLSGDATGGACTTDASDLFTGLDGEASGLAGRGASA